MPPRIPIAQAAPCCRGISSSGASRTSLVSLFAALSIQTRSESILANLSDNRGAYHKRIRVGRGPSSGYGKTSGRGHKGQGQHGKVNPWFQGGQTPLLYSHGRKGFVNFRAPVMTEVNLEKLQAWIDAGRIDASKPITPKEIYQSGLARTSLKDGIKLLARGKEALRTPVDILVSRASGAAIEAIERAGGKIVTRYFTKASLRRLLSGDSISSATPLPLGAEHIDAELAKLTGADGRRLYRLPDPTSRGDIEYYRDPAHRGYLSHMLKPGESPSLYYRVPAEEKTVTQSKRKKAKVADKNRLF